MKTTIIALAAALLIIIGAVWLAGERGDSSEIGEGNNITVVDGRQIIDLTARGGYSPRLTRAQAGLPTVIKMKTTGTFDCSSALVIPDLNYRANLPPSGVTEIAVPPQVADTTLTGLCAMGMYSFAIKFD
jgi:Cu+-exporting ATPase